MLMTLWTVLGLLVLLALCVGGFVLLVGAANDSARSGNFFACWACWDWAGEVLKLAGLVLVALVQAAGEATKG